MSNDVLLAISADSHVTEPDDCYFPNIDPKFRDRAPRATTTDQMGATMVIDNGVSNIPYGMIAGAGRDPKTLGPFTHTPWDELHPGGWDPIARLAEQDTDGVTAEVIYPSVGMLLCNHPDAAYKKACFDAYNRWIAEFNAGAPERLLGVGQTTLRSVEEGISDLQSIADLGLPGVMLPGMPETEEDFDDPMWDPLWEAAIDLGLVLSFHILTAGGGLGSKAFRGPKMNSFIGIIRSNQDVIGTMIYGGTFERNPDLRVVCVEADAGWAPHWMYRADHAYKRHTAWLDHAPLSRMPSEYFNEHVYLTFQDDAIAFKTVDLMNHERLMWANDHPHSDATWPWSQDVLAEHTAGMSDHVRDRIIKHNVADLYGMTAP